MPPDGEGPCRALLSLAPVPPRRGNALFELSHRATLPDRSSVQVTVSTTRPFHSAMLANALVKHGSRVRIYTSVTRRYFRRLDPSVALTLVPSPLQTAMHFLHFPVTHNMLHADSWLYDHSVAAVIRPEDLFIGWASAAFTTSRVA